MNKPLFVEIKGVQFRNKGAYLMLLACLEGLKGIKQPVELVLSPGPNLPYVERARLGAWQKLSLRRGGLDLGPLIGKLPGAVQRRKDSVCQRGRSAAHSYLGRLFYFCALSYQPAFTYY